MWAILYDWAEEGLKRGLKGVFGKGSVLLTGGGKKGKALPNDWRERVLEFIGFDNIYEMYGTSEMMGICMMCEPATITSRPIIVPFLLDPRRAGRCRARMARPDALPDSI